MKQCAQAEILKGDDACLLARRRVCCDQKLFSAAFQIGDRQCPECRSSMRLAWIEPDEKPGYDKRALECLPCHHLDTVTMKLR